MTLKNTWKIIVYTTKVYFFSMGEGWNFLKWEKCKDEGFIVKKIDKKYGRTNFISHVIVPTHYTV